MRFGGVRERSERSEGSVVVVSENESDSASGSRSATAATGDGR